jgi:peroxin-16
MASTFPQRSAPQAASRPALGRILAMPPQWLAMYDDFISRNAGQVSQMESALRSLTYIIPGE